MPESQDGKSSVPLKQVFNPLARFPRGMREGRVLAKALHRNLNDPDAAFSIQNVRDQIFFHSPNRANGGKIVGFAGPTGKEGVSSISILLGLTLGELKRSRVIFIDGRLERDRFALYREIFGLTKNGLNYNNGCGSFHCYNSRNKSFCFLAAGAETVNSLEVFSAADFGHLTSELRNAFDYVIFDMPSVLGSSETRLLLPHLDLFFLVCLPRKTTYSEVERSKALISALGGSITGVILNQQKPPFWASFFGRDTFF